MAAPFLRRIQTRPVNPLFGTTLLDAASAGILSFMAFGAAFATFSLYEIEFPGAGWIPWLIGAFAFVRLLGYYRLRGDGVVHKDGIFRAQQSNLIRQVIAPAFEVEFVVVTAVGKRRAPFLRRLFDGFAYGLKLQKRPENPNRVAGEQYCMAVARRYRAMKQDHLEG